MTEPSSVTTQKTPYFFVPILLFYVGPLLGPLAPVLVAAPHVRKGSVVTLLFTLLFSGIATWLIIQGANLFLNGVIPYRKIRYICSAINLIYALFAAIYFQRATRNHFIYTTKTYYLSAIAFIVTAAFSFLSPPLWTSWLGR